MTVVVALSVEKKKAYKRKRDSRPGPCRWADLRDTAKSDPRLPSVTLWVSCTPRQNIRKLGDILGRLEKSSAVEYVNRWET